MAKSNNIDRLYEVGFQILGTWELTARRKLALRLTPDNDSTRTRLTSGPALYAFISGTDILYLGKTSLSLVARFGGYKNPGARQQTNIKCSKHIIDFISSERRVDVLSLSGVTQLRWGEFELNIAAGLEDSLIAQLSPQWNGRTGHSIMTESEQIERESLNIHHISDEAPASGKVGADVKATGTFTIKLGETYYQDGIINPGVKVKHLLGGHDEEIWLRLGRDDSKGVQTTINRKAVASDSPRLKARKEVAAWFQKNFKLGDTVTGIIISPHQIILELPQVQET